MFKKWLVLLVYVGQLFATSVSTAATYKCEINGTTTFQQTPCPSGHVRERPTVEELNATEQKRRANSTKSAADHKPTPTLPSEHTGFRCDGRTFCSQMKSCAEAKYFLANCPGVKMDGNRDAIPCEQQWCSR